MDAVNSLSSMSPLPPVASGASALNSIQNGSADKEKVAAEFESVFVSMLLKEMRSTLDEGLFSGESSDTYGGLFDMYLSRHLSETGGIGLKEALLDSFDPTKISGAVEGSA